jgi:hypothetical protein
LSLLKQSLFNQNKHSTIFFPSLLKIKFRVLRSSKQMHTHCLLIFLTNKIYSVNPRPHCSEILRMYQQPLLIKHRTSTYLGVRRLSSRQRITISLMKISKGRTIPLLWRNRRSTLNLAQESISMRLTPRHCLRLRQIISKRTISQKSSETFM